jgi:cathepsin L
MYLGGYKRMPAHAANYTTVSKRAKDLPLEVDWRSQGVISDVKDQGRCGSCWAFAATETIESYAAIATGTLSNLSIQQMTSCTPNPLSCGGSGGCSGSIPQLGYNYIQLFGQASDENYP